MTFISNIFLNTFFKYNEFVLPIYKKMIKIYKKEIAVYYRMEENVLMIKVQNPKYRTKSIDPQPQTHNHKHKTTEPQNLKYKNKPTEIKSKETASEETSKETKAKYM